MREDIGAERGAGAEEALRPDQADPAGASAGEEPLVVPTAGLEDEPLEDLEGVPGRMTLITGEGAGPQGISLEPGERWQDALRRLQSQRAGTGRAYAIVLELLTACCVVCNGWW